VLALRLVAGWSPALAGRVLMVDVGWRRQVLAALQKFSMLAAMSGVKGFPVVSVHDTEWTVPDTG
jgi:hypothetical protein